MDLDVASLALLGPSWSAHTDAEAGGALCLQEGVICLQAEKAAPVSAYLVVWPQPRSAHLCASANHDHPADLLRKDL